MLITSAEKPDVTIDFGFVTIFGTLIHDDVERALFLLTEEGYEHISTNLSAYDLEPSPGNVFIKGWSEHTGLTTNLVEQGLVRIVSSLSVGPFSATAYEVEVTL
ncbi:hypothetical protein [Brevibacterium oceani]|uniref:hypothetical protein n=1 Tax=Brevibacterium oceani TaxID=358099 RepID=UPI0015E69B76|nr:hypothetical protein [Brevibacterium oceani]